MSTADIFRDEFGILVRGMRQTAEDFQKANIRGENASDFAQHQHDLETAYRVTMELAVRILGPMAAEKLAMEAEQ